MVGWRTGEPIVLSHADAALPTTQSEPLQKRFLNILVLIKRDALLAGAGVLNTSQMELNGWKVKCIRFRSLALLCASGHALKS